MKNDLSKKWFKYSLINIMVLFVVYGIMLLCMILYAYNAMRTTGGNMLVNYASELSQSTKEDLNSHFDKQLNFNYINPNFSFALFQLRQDGSLEMKTLDEYLDNNQVKLDKAQVGTRREKVGEQEYLTYVTQLKNDESDVFIKVFMPLGIADATNNSFTLFMIIFAVVFVVVSLGASVAIGYFEIKPIALTYEKQKNFINDMSHEIRTPLAIIKGNLENVILDNSAKVQDVSDLIDESLQEVEHIGDMASGLLNIVRSSNVMAKGAKGNACSVINEIVDVYSDLGIMQNKALIASVEIINMEVDKEKFKQLLVILLDNALKYTNSGDKIKLRFKKTDKGCALIVSDTGIGVPHEELESIFSRFYRASNATELEGTGLGLSIAKAIVDNMGGSIVARHNSPKGLTVVAEFNL